MLHTVSLEANWLSQPHKIRRSHTIHRPCNLAYYYHAQSQSNHHRIHPLFPRCHSQLCWVGHDFQPYESGYLARSVEGQARGKAGHVWGRYLAEVISWHIFSCRGYFKLFRIGQCLFFKEMYSRISNTKKPIARISPK